MKPQHHINFFCRVLLMGILPWSAQARVVSTLEDEIRLNGFADQQKREEAAEKLRLSDLDEYKKQALKEKNERELSLNDYREEKDFQSKVMDEAGEDYRENLELRLQDMDHQEELREKFVSHRDRRREQAERTVTLTEEQEFGIPEPGVRADWKDRKFVEVAKAGSASGSSSNSGGAPSYYEAPPPPPSMGGYENNQNWEMPPPPPPPPPGMFEDEAPY